MLIIRLLDAFFVNPIYITKSRYAYNQNNYFLSHETELKKAHNAKRLYSFKTKIKFCIAMKILSAAQTRALDAYTIAHEPITSADLMERASAAFVRWFVAQYKPPQTVQIICGIGNNGGDGLCIARLLLQRHYNVSVIVVCGEGNPTPDFLLNQQRAKRLQNLPFIEINEQDNVAASINETTNNGKEDPLPEWYGYIVNKNNALIIDALFGSGLNRPLQGIYAQVVECMNQSTCELIAIDIPSGLYADQASNGRSIVKATHTVTFELPKLAFLLPENYPHIGEWHCVSIGLDQQAIAQTHTPYFYLDKQTLPQYKPKQKFAHKGTRGHALIIGGSMGKIGAPALATRAALHCGAGLVTVYAPNCGYNILQTIAPEAMTLSDNCHTHIAQLPSDLSPYRAIGIGVGLGQHPDTIKALHQLLLNPPCPLVIDADALNIIAAQHWQNLIPPQSLLTPHPKEWERLAGKSNNDFERIALLRQKTSEWQCYIALKGAHTAIVCPNGQVYFNSTGNPAMATGGSGDVLTGILTAYLAQGYTPQDALLIGVFKHGEAGDWAKKNSYNGNITAQDMISPK